LRLFGLTAVGYMWARAAVVAATHDNDDPTGFYADKIATARFYMQRVLPQSSAAFAALMAGGATINDFPEEAF
jgi:hypothetical protein